MRASVLIPTFNKVAILRETLASLAASGPPPDLEVVVASDGSSDGTADYLSSARLSFALVPVLLPANVGRAAARNRALERTTGELVVFLDDDMQVEPGFVQAHLEFHKQSAAAGTGGAAGPVAGVGNVRERPEVMATAIGRYMATRGAQKIQDHGPLPWRYFTTNNSSVPRADLVAVGGLDEAYRHYGFEDMDLGLRLAAERGIRFGFVAGARSTHLETYGLDDVLKKKRLCGEHSLRRFLARHPETLEELGLSPWVALSTEAGDAARARVQFPYAPLFARAPYEAALAWAQKARGPVPDLVFDFLVLWNYVEGLRTALPGNPVSGTGGIS